ncbi:MAG TPA: malectin domain-containing carbohydrate-binding protein [Candidatus Acidoferrum sp.]|nr:malectin domain-containing carbohydrate-binding protein [Candidatus Acidoferrum sp.]
MVVAGDYAAEKAELEHVLASGIFDRSPSLAQLLTYVCNKYFQGTAGEIKEYNIAVEALGRHADFDQKRDSIVRVQFHRLRERLNEYYQNEGASSAVRIHIPQGQYIPHFVMAAAVPVAPPAAAPLVSPTPSAPSPARRWALIALALVAVAVSGIWIGSHTGSRVQRAGIAPTGVVPGSGTVRLLAGLAEGTFTDGFGNEWLSDRYFEGGSVIKLPGHAIAGTRDPRLYQSRRQGGFRYDIPLTPGVYELRLHFAETHFGEDNTAGFGGEGSRAFAVLVNEAKVLDRLDVFGEAGASTAHVKVFKDVSPAGDGKLHLSFNAIVTVPFLNAIEITPGTPGKLRPIRIVAQPRAVTDTAGITWAPDRFAVGGQVVKRSNQVSGTEHTELFEGERFGNLTYTIPVPAGAYALTLYMAERWLGPGMPGGGGAGSRLFDILCNGVALARDFDIFSRAGGSNRALVETFHGLRPDHQGRLVLHLLPAKNFALVNAIEVTDESRP